MKPKYHVDRERSIHTHSLTLYEIETDDHINQTGTTTECCQDQTSVKTITNPTENTRQNPLQITEPCCLISPNEY